MRGSTSSIVRLLKEAHFPTGKKRNRPLITVNLAQLLMRLHAHYTYPLEQFTELETAPEQELSRDETGQRLQTIPDVGPITASVLSSQPGDGKQYGCNRDFAASTGLVPRQYSTGEKIRF